MGRDAGSSMLYSVCGGAAAKESLIYSRRAKLCHVRYRALLGLNQETTLDFDPKRNQKKAIGVS